MCDNALLLIAQFVESWSAGFESCYVSFRVSFYKCEPNYIAANYHVFICYMRLTILIINKMKKLVKMIKQVKIMKLVIMRMRNVPGCWENQSQS